MDFPVFPRKKYSGWQKPSAARHSAEIFVPEGHIFHCKALPAQIVQLPRVRGQVKGQLVGIQGLPRLAVAAVYVPTAVFAVPSSGQSRSAIVARIWWVRPVSSPISTKLSSPRISSTL